jgi:hypothetical protein
LVPYSDARILGTSSRAPPNRRDWPAPVLLVHSSWQVSDRFNKWGGMGPPSTGFAFDWTRLRLDSLPTGLDLPSSTGLAFSRLDRFLRVWTRFLRLNSLLRLNSPSSTRRLLRLDSPSTSTGFFDFNRFLPLDSLSSTGLAFVDRT